MAAPVLPPGVHVLERGWLSANNILFTDGAQTLMIDSGHCAHAGQTVALVQSVLGQCPLDLLLNTHLHNDHCGGNAALQAHYPALQTWIAPGHAPQVAHCIRWRWATSQPARFARRSPSSTSCGPEVPCAWAPPTGRFMRRRATTRTQ